MAESGWPCELCVGGHCDDPACDYGRDCQAAFCSPALREHLYGEPPMPEDQRESGAMTAEELAADFKDRVRKQAVWRFPDGLLDGESFEEVSHPVNRAPRAWTEPGLHHTRRLYITDVIEFAEEAAQQARVEEREACAQIADEIAGQRFQWCLDNDEPDWAEEDRDTIKIVSREIRARSSASEE